MRKTWTQSSVTLEAMLFETRKDFFNNSQSAYAYAVRNKILEEVCVHMKKRKFWDIDSAIVEAKKYKSKQQLRKKAKGVFEYGVRHKCLSKLCEHMNLREPSKSWSKDSVYVEALKFKTRCSFKKNSIGAYNHALRNNILDYVCQHMDDGLACDNDIIYIWKVNDLFHNKKQVYKVGITSKRLGANRIHFVAQGMKCNYDIIIMSNTICKASKVESKLLKLGDNPNIIGVNGSTELRAFTSTELQKCLNIIHKNQKQRFR